MNKSFFLLLTSLFLFTCKTQEPLPANQPEAYTLVTYNIENLFDADGVAVFDDYKTTDRDGNDQYTKEDVLTKIRNAIQVLMQYNEGKGPDIIAMVELESDFTPSGESTYADIGDFLGQFAHTSLEKMLTTEFTEKVADLPSEWLLLKGMVDAGMWNYNLEVGYPPLEDGEPSMVQKTAVFSRFPILKEKTQIHPLERARPILETWIDVNGSELVVFANHWKSGAGSWEMEQVRLQNAEVLRDRLDVLLSENPDLDYVLAGDFNSDYNQKARYEFEQTAINDVLGSTGEEEAVSVREEGLYNLWYELPREERGSDTYRGYWGTLMQIIISSGMYDEAGIQYVDNSFARGDFGFNTFSSSGEPKHWSSTFDGSGYSDHLPVSMKFRAALPREGAEYSFNDDSLWSPNAISYTIPKEFISSEEFMASDPTKNPDFYNEYFYLTATVTDRYDFVVNGTTFDVYAPSFRLNEVLGDVAGTDTAIKFYGRFSQYRGNWQFVVESQEYIEIQE
jgi:hypothetical protein